MSGLTCHQNFRGPRPNEMSAKQRKKLREKLESAVGKYQSDVNLMKTDYAHDTETMLWLWKKYTGKDLDFDYNPISLKDVRKFNMGINWFSKTIAKRGKGKLDFFKVPKAILRKFPELAEFQENLSHEASFFRSNQISTKIKTDTIIDGWIKLAKKQGGDIKKLKSLEGELEKLLTRPDHLRSKEHLERINELETSVIKDFMIEGSSKVFRDFNSLMNGLKVEELGKPDANGDKYDDADMRIWREIDRNMIEVRESGIKILGAALNKVISTAKILDAQEGGARGLESAVLRARDMIKALEFQSQIDTETKGNTKDQMEWFEELTAFGYRKSDKLRPIQKKYMPLYVIGATKLLRSIDMEMRNDKGRLNPKDIQETLANQFDSFTKQTSRIMEKGNIEDARYSIDPAYFLKKYVHDISTFNFTTHLENNFWRQTSKVLEMHAKGTEENNQDVMDLADNLIRQMNEMKDSMIGIDPNSDKMINDLSRIMTSVTYLRLMGGNLRSAARNGTQRLYEFIEFGGLGVLRARNWRKKSTTNQEILARAAKKFGLSWYANEHGGLFGRSRDLPIEQATRGAIAESGNIPKGFRLNELGEIVKAQPGAKQVTKAVADVSGKIAGMGGKFHQMVEDWNRASTFETAFALSYENLQNAPKAWLIKQMNRKVSVDKRVTDATPEQIQRFIENKAGRVAYNATTDLHFEYARWAKAKPFKGPIGQVGGQFMHYRMSMFDMMHKWTKEAGVSMLAGDFTSQEAWRVYRMGFLFAMIEGMSMAFNMNLGRLAQNDVVESMSNLWTFMMADRDDPKEAAELEKATYGQGAWSFAGPNIVYAANLGEIAGMWHLGDDSFLKQGRVVEASENFTRQQKFKTRSLINSQYARFRTYTLPILAKRGLWDAGRYELGLMPDPEWKNTRTWIGHHAKKNIPYDLRDDMGLTSWGRGTAKRKYPLSGPYQNPMAGKRLSAFDMKRVRADIDFIRGKATPAQVLNKKTTKKRSKGDNFLYNERVLESLSLLD